MSETAPERAPRGGGGGNWLSRSPLLGVPNWLWILIGAGALGTGWILYRNHQKAATANSQQSTAPSATSAATACVDSNGSPVDCNSLLAVNSEGQSQYEQLTSQLQGVSGQDAALAAAIQQINGQSSTPASSSGGGTTTATQAPPPTNATMRAMGINNFGNLLQWAAANGYTATATRSGGNGGVLSSSTNNNPQYWHWPVYSVSTNGTTISAQIAPN